MATQVQNRRGTTAEHSTFTGANGELTVDTTKKTVVVHDGTTAGGAPLLRENGSQNAVTTGTSTAASFIPTSSTVPTNGVYLPAANTIGLATNSNGRVFVDSQGRVGIGTTAVNAPLHVSNGGAAGLEFYPATYEIQAYNRSTSAYGLARYNAAGHQFAVSATEAARIDSSGRLLVGKSSASSSATFQANTPNVFIAGGDNGFLIENTATKTYPSSGIFSVSVGLHQDIQIGTNQTIPTALNGSSIRGIYNRLIKSDGTNTDITGVGITGINNIIEWNDANLARQLSGNSNLLLVSGTSASGSTFINGSVNNINITNPSNTTISGLRLTGTSANINLGTYGSTAQTITASTLIGLLAGFQCPHNQVGKNLSITTAYGVRAFLSFGDNFNGYDGSNCVTTITNLYQFEGTGYLAARGAGSTTTVTNLYGLFLGQPTTDAGTTITNNWGIYQNWSSAKNWFAGASNQFPNVTTTASGANAFLDSADSNRLYRSTSSIVYKKDVEDLDHALADNIHQFRPVWYRSKCENDCQDWSWFGLIAEEVAAIEPRLVHYGYQEDAYELIDITDTVELQPDDPRRESGQETEEVTKQERRLKSDAQKVPNGVAYDRLTVLLLDVVQRQEDRIKDLEARLIALESA
jgi:hypothetical protein